MIFAFWTILTIVICVRLYWKHSAHSRHDSLRDAFLPKKKKKPELPITGNAGFSPELIAYSKARAETHETEKKEKEALKEAQKAQKKIDEQRERDIEYLRKQGYTEEIIAVILPTINNGQ